MVAGFGLHALYPIGMRGASGVVGFLLIALAIAVDIWVFVIFRRQRTNIRPDRPAKALVTEGPFQWSRNPIYLANIAILLGVAFAKDSFWFVVMALLFFLLIGPLAISREERHLADQFGHAWEEYAARVRRWL